jgi:hypothetical protein
MWQCVQYNNFKSFCLFDLFVFTKAISYDNMIRLTLFTGIQYKYCNSLLLANEQFTSPSQKKCRNFVVMQRTLSNCSCFTIFKRQVNVSVS